jgi:high-affinity K+ transport system ATPase subunit B
MSGVRQGGHTYFKGAVDAILVAAAINGSRPAEAKPEEKIRLIREEQAAGHLVAMTGDGTNDAPALAQADVGLAMSSGTAAPKEAANMVDLDSNPTKLIEVVAIGKQLPITRGAITTFSVTNDVAKYFAIIPSTSPSFQTCPGFGAPGSQLLIWGVGGILSPFVFVQLIDLVVTALRLG